MKYTYHPLFVAGVALVATALSHAETKAVRDTRVAWPVASQDVVWDSPSTDAKGSMPLGNGDIGLNVWVELSGDLVLLVGKTASFDEFNRLLKIGRIRVRTTPALFHPGMKFSQALRLADGAIEIKSGDTFIRVWVDANHPVAQVDLASTTPVEVQVLADNWRTENRAMADDETSGPGTAWGNWPDKMRVNADTVLPKRNGQIGWCHHNVESQWKRNLELTALGALGAEVAKGKDPVMNRSFGALSGGIALPTNAHTWKLGVDSLGGNRFGGEMCDNTYIRRYWQSGLELVAMMLDHYDGTQDTAFRDQTLLPLAKSIIAFFDQHWPRVNGKILFEPAQSPDTMQIAKNPMPEVVGMHYLLPQFLKLPVDEATKAAWNKTLADLPPVPIGTTARHTHDANETGPFPATEGGLLRLLPAETYSAKRNFENAELYGVFPYRMFTVMAGKESLELALNAWRVRLHPEDFGWQQNCIQAALLGLADKAKTMVTARAAATATGYRFPGLFGPNYDWTPDQNHPSGMVIAVQRMLMQCDGDKIALLPAWPADWNASFKLHAPKVTTIESRVEKGAIIELKVTPESRRKASSCLPENSISSKHIIPT